MPLPTLSDIRYTVLAYIPFDTGFMFTNATRYSEDATKYVITYDGNAVPYIGYVEGKWIDPRWNGKKNRNEGFIKTDTVNALSFLINQASGREKSLIMAKNKSTVQYAASQISQGTLQQLKGNKL